MKNEAIKDAKDTVLALVRQLEPVRTPELAEAVVQALALQKSMSREVRKVIRAAHAAGEVRFIKLDRERFITSPTWKESMESVLLRIDGRVVKNPDTGCLEWRDTLDSKGRAVIYSDAHGTLLVRRVLFDRHRQSRNRPRLGRYESPVPVCHCDGHCVEPTHMRVRKHSEVLSGIVRDVDYCRAMAAHRRASSPLTEEMVADIKRRVDESITSIHKDYSQVTRSAISAIRRGRVWKDYEQAKQPTPFTGLGARQ